MVARGALERLFRPEVLALSAYHVADARGLIKLDAMENPYPWPEEVQEAWLDSLRGTPVNRYPDPQAGEVQQLLRQYDGIDESMELLLGNGSDELIQILLMAVARPGATVLAPEPTFVMYRQIASCLGLRFVGVPLRADDFALDGPAMLDAISQYQPAVIFLAYPNNPTGNLFDSHWVRQIVAAAPGLVVVDEAYGPFAGSSYLPDLHEHEGLLVMRTLSKLGLAGLRLGYLVGDPAWIHELDKLRLPYNINVLTQRSVVFALGQQALLASQVQRILEGRTWLHEALSALSWVQVFTSAANFITFRVLGVDASDIHQRLRQQGVLIKNLHPAGGLLAHCLRVTIGTEQENQAFILALKRCVS